MRVTTEDIIRLIKAKIKTAQDAEDAGVFAEDGAYFAGAVDHLTDLLKQIESGAML